MGKAPGPTDPTATFYFPVADAALGLRSDQRQSDGTFSTYANGVCGVSAKIFATTQYSNSGDATMQTGTSKSRTCAPRTITVDYGDGQSYTGGTFINVKTIQNTTFSIPIGATTTTFLLLDDGSRCSGLRWRPVLSDGTVTGADAVNITRLDASTWRVWTSAYPNNKAYCLNTGQLFNISADLTIRSSYALP